MKIKENTFYIDMFNKDIYFFVDVVRFIGILWKTSPSNIISGEWGARSCSFLKSVSERFELLRKHNLTEYRKRIMIQQLFERDINI